MVVKRKRLSSSSSKPVSSSMATTTTTTTAALQSTSRRSQHGRQSNQTLADADTHRIEVKRSRSTDSADSTSAPQVRGRSAPTYSTRENGKTSLSNDAFPDIDSHTAEALSPISDKVSLEQQSHSSPVDTSELQPTIASNGQRSRADKLNKASSVNSAQSAAENPTIPQISVTESSSTTEATPSLANGRATASESLSSLSEIDTVDSEAETERIEEDADEDPESLERTQITVEDEPPPTSGLGTSEEDDAAESEQIGLSRTPSSRTPTRGRKRRRENVEEPKEDTVSTDEKPEQADETDELLLKRSRTDEDEKPIDADDIEAQEEPEEPEPEEVDEEKAEANKKRLAALEMLREIEDEFAKLRDRIFAERSAEIVCEQELVNSNQHPDIQKLFIELNNARTERIRRAKVTRKYRLQEIVRKYDVEAEFVKHQYLADRAMIREKLISELTAQWFQIHREKRTIDMCVPDFGWKVPERRSVQIKHRKAQNHEIMCLEETKKWFGMPAAPKISRISDEEIKRDLALMRQRPSYDVNMVDENGFYSGQPSQSSQQYVPTGFQDRYYPVNAPPLNHQPQQPASAPQPLPSPPPATHPTSINSLLSHDTPPPQPQRQSHHHHHHHSHHHHHHHAARLPTGPPSSTYYSRLPPLPGSRMNHIVDPTDRERDHVKLEHRREGFY